MQNKKKILVCPLNWGLGHATRMVPIIYKLQNLDFDVLIGANGNSLEYLQKEFTGIKTVEFPAYSVRYSKRKSQLISMYFLLPKIIFWTIREHILLKKLIHNYNIDIVISDNRFGLWNKKIYSIFITHQLKVKFPGFFKLFEFVYTKLVKKIINKYNECWVPDFAGNKNLSGELSHRKSKPQNTHFIGPLSRFELMEYAIRNKIYDVLFILSGPEPQRTLFENIIIKQATESNLKCALVRGVDKKHNIENGLIVFDTLNTSELIEILEKSKVVICRSGYSSIMDLIVLKKPAVLVPTPGQTEQEYLANYLNEKGLFYTMSQKAFNLELAFDKCYQKPEFDLVNEDGTLKKRLEELNKKYN